VASSKLASLCTVTIALGGREAGDRPESSGDTPLVSSFAEVSTQPLPGCRPHYLTLPNESLSCLCLLISTLHLPQAKVISSRGGGGQCHLRRRRCSRGWPGSDPSPSPAASRQAPRSLHTESPLVLLILRAAAALGSPMDSS
jgi:hypothetical protein